MHNSPINSTMLEELADATSLTYFMDVHKEQTETQQSTSVFENR